MEEQKRPAPPRHRIGGHTTHRGQQIAGLYDLEETLGEGHYAVVKLARHVFTGEKVAVKIIDKMKLDAATRVQMLQEVQLMKLVQHAHVVRLYEVIDTQTKLYLILEYADGGDMYDYIMKHEGGLQEEQAKRYFRQIVAAIQYCHKLHVVHRDLKPENVVFFENLGIVKLTDFGFSNQFDPGQRLQTSCGSLAYSAPEILLGDSYDAPAVDIWSLGVILYMLVCGTAPFQEANDSETLTMIMDCKYTFPKHISQACKSLISRMLQRQPDCRASLNDIVDDPWLGGPGDADGNAIPISEQLPLVSRNHLTSEEHALILTKMVNGEVANKEDILEALDMNEYNHITATYFLLAERKLKLQRQRLAHQLIHGNKEDTGNMSKSLEFKSTEDISVRTAKELSLGGPIKNSMVDSLLSPERENLSSTHHHPVRIPSPKNTFARMTHNISILEEEEEEEEEEEYEFQQSRERGEEKEMMSFAAMGFMPISSHTRTLSRHSSTSSLIGSPPACGSPAILDIGAITAGLRSHQSGATEDLFADQLSSGQQTPAPFPVSSHIGTGGLSRQSSLRRTSSEVAESTSAASAPAVVISDRQHSAISSPSTPPNSGSASSSAQGSPARYKMKKLVSTRSSPQLMLNQIHEESEEGTASPSAILPEEPDPVDSFPTSSAGVAVIRRLEQRRRLHKSRTQSCSSSDASDDDSEARRQRKHFDKSGTPPSFKRDSQHDDSSDSQEPGVGATTSSLSQGSFVRGVGNGGARTTKSTGKTTTTGSSSTTGNNKTHNHHQQQHASSSSSTTSSAPSRTRHRSLQHGSRIRQSHSLNRISELHVADFSSDHASDLDVSNNNSSCPSSVASIANGNLPNKQITPQLSFESDSEGAPFDMLTRYLESLTVGNGRHALNYNSNRSRDDSQNSSDGEQENEKSSSNPPAKTTGSSSSSSSNRRHKVNLRVLEQRLNKIQEENNKSADEEEGEVDEEDNGELSDDPSTLPDECDNKYDPDRSLYCDNNKHQKSDDEQEIKIDIYNPKLFTHNLHNSNHDDNDNDRNNELCDETRSIKSCHEMSNFKQRKRIHRAHSCGSLLGLKEKALLQKNLPVLLDFLTSNSNGGKNRQASLQLTSTDPLSLLQLQSTSRCCNLC